MICKYEEVSDLQLILINCKTELQIDQLNC